MDSRILYRANKWANYAILLLQGRVLVMVSSEGLVFEAGPFMLFGETVFKKVNELFSQLSDSTDPSIQSAKLATEARFMPDYTVTAQTNLQYLRITAEHYMLARRLTTLQQRSGKACSNRIILA
ncbi:unnamed protein product [Protopolystoma xenopodis]|uniref:Uncharacterized protein n=1 Tax=Protopolystoma xenopodis TaxID=117903 RepID=A0A448WAR2_9PLAT|nr:unnamed protein product [Protopolystoma xenopodis]